MQFMVRIEVRVPGEWSEAQVKTAYAAEVERAHELMQAGIILRLWRVAGARANFGLWEADSLEELHSAISSLPLFPFLEPTVTPVIEHPSISPYKEKYGTLPVM